METGDRNPKAFSSLQSPVSGLRASYVYLLSY